MTKSDCKFGNSCLRRLRREFRTKEGVGSQFYKVRKLKVEPPKRKLKTPRIFRCWSVWSCWQGSACSQSDQDHCSEHSGGFQTSQNLSGWAARPSLIKRPFLDFLGIRIDSPWSPIDSIGSMCGAVGVREPCALYVYVHMFQKSICGFRGACMRACTFNLGSFPCYHQGIVQDLEGCLDSRFYFSRLRAARLILEGHNFPAPHA